MTQSAVSPPTSRYRLGNDNDQTTTEGDFMAPIDAQNDDSTDKEDVTQEARRDLRQLDGPPTSVQVTTTAAGYSRLTIGA
jgi:hypothetical protein